MGADELAREDVASFVRRAFDQGLTVAVSDADADAAEQLRLLVGRDVPVALDHPVRLVALADDTSTGRFTARTHLLEPRADGPAGDDDGAAGEADFLRQVFTRLADGDLVTDDDGDSPTDELTQLGASVMTHALKSDRHGNQLQVVNNIWAARSFDTDSAYDYHYVEQTMTNLSGNDDVGIAVTTASNTLESPSSDPIVETTSPGTTQNATTYTSGISYGLSGNAGYQTGAGLLTASPSLSISKSTSTTVEPTNIENREDPATGVTEWKYTTDCGNNCLLDGKSYQSVQHYIWAVPFATTPPTRPRSACVPRRPGCGSCSAAGTSTSTSTHRCRCRSTRPNSRVRR